MLHCQLPSLNKFSLCFLKSTCFEYSTHLINNFRMWNSGKKLYQMILILENLWEYYPILVNVFPVTKMKVTAGDGSFLIETSHWGVFYMDTQENLLGVSRLKNYKWEHPRRRLFYRYKTNIFKRPFIEIYGESHNDYSHASKNCKMLHDRPIWNIFLPILENILITTLCYFISEREVHWCYCPLIIVKNATVSLEGSATAVNITDNIDFLLHICSFLRTNNKKGRFSLVLPPFPVKGQVSTR